MPVHCSHCLWLVHSHKLSVSCPSSSPDTTATSPKSMTHKFPSFPMSLHTSPVPTVGLCVDVLAGRADVFPPIVFVCAPVRVCVRDRERFMMNWVSPNPSVPGWAWNGSSCFRVRRWRRASGMWGWPACVFHPPHFAAAPLPHTTFLKFLSWNKKSISGRIRASGISAVQVVLNILECITTHKKCSCIVRNTHC